MELIADRYEIESELGQGGMGILYLAHDELPDRHVAIKVVNDPNLGEIGRERLLREARLAAQLNHGNIVAIHDVIETDGTPQVVNEERRVRAWVLVKATKSKVFSKALATKYRDERREYEFGGGSPNLVVVRADVVEGERDRNVVVPVDAKSEGILEAFVEKIKNYKGVTAVSVLKVSDGGHNPDRLMGLPPTSHGRSSLMIPLLIAFRGGDTRIAQVGMPGADLALQTSAA